MNEADLREEGEVASDEGEANVYKTIDRPKQNFRPQQKLMDSDSQSSDDDQDSDDDGIKMRPKIKNKQINKPSIHHRVNPPRKNGNLWSTLLQEETLTEDLQTFDVSASRKRKHERGAESYDFEHKGNNSELLTRKRKKFDRNSNDSSSSNASNKSQEKRKMKKAKHRKKNNPLKSSKILPNILISFNNSDEEYGQVLAKNLEEDNVDLIIRAVSVIGKDESLKLYTATQNIEQKGGLLTMNKERRRTPGGLFLFLLKTSKSISEKQKKEVFNPEKDKQMSEGNWSAEKTDPPPPSPAEEVATNNCNPDPNFVSQRILNSFPEDDILKLDCNEDMDTF